MGMMNKVCAFTGHRPSKLPWRCNKTDSRCVALRAVLAEQIAVLVTRWWRLPSTLSGLNTTIFSMNS